MPPRFHFRPLISALALVAFSLAIAGCAPLPASGPSTGGVERGDTDVATGPIQVVEVTDGIARRLLAGRRSLLFSDSLPQQSSPSFAIGSGDVIEVNVWEAPPATLFGSGSADARSPSTARSTAFPEQMVDAEGYIAVPFAGRVRASGQSATAIGTEIRRRLLGKANSPEVIVRVIRNASSTVTVVGEVTNSVRMPLTPVGERLLDALAAAGGVRQPVGKTTVQLTRGSQYVALPLDVVIRDPRQNVPLQPGDIVTAIFQPLSFTALGATGRNEEINFEAQGITLAQALARAGGLIDARSDARGVFVFRFEPRNALEWPRQPVVTTPDGLVPVVYRFDLRDPGSFFTMQSFPIDNKDILYVSNAPAAELQKFLNLVFSVAYPALNFYQVTR